MLREGAVQPDWLPVLGPFSKVLDDLKDFLIERHRSGAKVFPPARQILTAFRETGLQQVRVVILGQDPYCGPGQAHGLSFSVTPGVRPPPSLNNIFRELKDDLGLPVPDHGCLLPWAHSGVLLLNAVLTVEQRQPGAHAGRGWETLTGAAIKALNERPGLVFMLWGAAARKSAEVIDRDKHLVLEAAHPSPRSADRGFFGCRHFSQCNRWLEQRGMQPVDWALPPRDELPAL